MNLETINKWLDEEYGCSYTKLEELHNFYFEKYCDLKQENKQLNDNWNKLKEWVKEQPIFNYLAPVDIKNKMRELEQGSYEED